MAFTLFASIQGWIQSLCRGAKQRPRQWTRHDNGSDSLAVGTAWDLSRSKIVRFLPFISFALPRLTGLMINVVYHLNKEGELGVCAGTAHTPTPNY